MNTQLTGKFAALVLALAMNALMVASVAYLFDSHVPQRTTAIVSASSGGLVS